MADEELYMSEREKEVDNKQAGRVKGKGEASLSQCWEPVTFPF